MAISNSSRVRIGDTSVSLTLGKLMLNIVFLFPLDEPETRDGWWYELRIEIRSHMKAMGCSAVIGYTETTAIW